MIEMQTPSGAEGSYRLAHIDFPVHIICDEVNEHSGNYNMELPPEVVSVMVAYTPTAVA
jgi:hypothetical protein